MMRYLRASYSDRNRGKNISTYSTIDRVETVCLANPLHTLHQKTNIRLHIVVRSGFFPHQRDTLPPHIAIFDFKLAYKKEIKSHSIGLNTYDRDHFSSLVSLILQQKVLPWL